MIEPFVARLTPEQRRELDVLAFLEAARAELDRDRRTQPQHPFMPDCITDRADEIEEHLVALEGAAGAEAQHIRAQVLQLAIEVAALAARIATEGDPGYAGAGPTPGAAADGIHA